MANSQEKLNGGKAERQDIITKNPIRKANAPQGD